MCGICGYVGAERPGLIQAMIAEIRHRGPDGEGCDSALGIHLGHARLAILDPSHGAQPLTGADGRYTVSYNGEIYNYPDLRRELEALGHRFETTCDTELLPLGFAAWGEGLFARLDGMFAFALRDNADGRLWLVRDQLGIKPLYYSLAGGELAFASSARALTRHPQVSRRLRPDAIQEFLQFRWVRSGRHLFSDVEILPPGGVLRWTEGEARLDRFWTPARRGPARNALPRDWAAEVELVLEDSVRRQLRADVALGIFLSGGVDSAMIGHYAARNAANRLTAFTFSTGDRVDETAQAAAMARDFGFDHRVVSLTASDFADFPQAVACLDNPVGDAVVLPTWKLCREAAREVKVVLTGEGADEMFAGYAHLPILRKLDQLGSVAGVLRLLAPLIRLMPVGLLNHLFDYQASLGRLGRDAAAELLAVAGDSGKMLARASAIMGDAEMAQATTLGPPPPRPKADLSLGGLLLDLTRGWLPEEILHKMDQLSMAHGLEARVPYVTTALYDLLLRCPDQMAMGKTLLRHVASQSGLAAARRRKVAFHLPVETLWRPQLEEMCREYLSPAMIRRHAILNEAFVGRSLSLLKAGEFLASKRLVAMVSLHAWLDAHT
ncbi:Asparagine synthetase glutamine-hydrolyzing [Paramagnetospirillum magnetotacticum MS-1]|uniref:asparagine synthase (glutamine-hydrolyzing) n=1 Tax=Paramagnetospirillum magnetotacticum MS-1 TaxID=272627 RepID=A0A0C2UV44_PARME|nr:asparagine synthase (glutamine-hydrolyzing) [Paramagnetospirillum magnetotacticum]KIL96696.1 Asparagine synthetase glutamine-hydrolyzing [Paramagnetospirillum magnetotacticum MS-1]